MDKAQKYDEIVRIWNKAVAKSSDDVWYLLCWWADFLGDIQDVLKDDLVEYIDISEYR